MPPPPPCRQSGEARYGANRWDTAEFASEQERAKFIKLMVGATAGSLASASLAAWPLTQWRALPPWLLAPAVYSSALVVG